MGGSSAGLSHPDVRYTLLGGCQLLAIGIIGEYVGRIFNEAKKRPPYIAESYDGEKC